MKLSHFSKAVVALVAAGLAIGVSGCSLFAPAYRDANGTVTATASVSASALKTGDCILNVSSLGSTVTKLEVVPCSSQHEAEVYAVNPKIDNVKATMDAWCTGDAFTQYIGVDFNSSKLDATYIHADKGATTDLQCIVYSEGNMVTTSYKGSAK